MKYDKYAYKITKAEYRLTLESAQKEENVLTGRTEVKNKVIED